MFKFIKYEEEYKNNIKNIIINDDYEFKKTLRFLEKYPQYTIIVKDNTEMIALSVFSGTSKTVDLILYVNPEYRRKGIGSKLLIITEKNMREAGVETVYCIHSDRETEKAFALKHGYQKKAIGSLMIYTNGKKPKPEYEVLPYIDKYYIICHNVISEAFHKMQTAIGIEDENFEFPPNERERIEFLCNAENIYLMRDDGEIVAAIILKDNEIDMMAVSVKHQRKGYGKQIAAFAINKLIDDGYNEIELNCILGNSADEFYMKLGFTNECVSSLVRREL